jgi:hypothetical protein
MTTLSKENDCLTMLVRLQADHPDKQRQAAHYNVSETHRAIKKIPGFLSASFLISHEGNQLVECTQWTSWNAFSAALSDPEFHHHHPVVQQIAVSRANPIKVHRIWGEDEAVVLRETDHVITGITLIEPPADQLNDFIVELTKAIDEACSRAPQGLATVALVNSLDLPFGRITPPPIVAEIVQWRTLGADGEPVAPGSTFAGSSFYDHLKMFDGSVRVSRNHYDIHATVVRQISQGLA